MFACTFEKDESCLLTNDYTNTTEIWDVVDGRGVVSDNTLNRGLCIHAVHGPESGLSNNIIPQQFVLSYKHVNVSEVTTQLFFHVKFNCYIPV